MATPAGHPAVRAASETRLESVQGADGVLLRRVAGRPSLQRVDGPWVLQGVSTAHTDWAPVIDCYPPAQALPALRGVGLLDQLAADEADRPVGRHAVGADGLPARAGQAGRARRRGAGRAGCAGRPVGQPLARPASRVAEEEVGNEVRNAR
jgi:hypothetical protein